MAIDGSAGWGVEGTCGVCSESHTPREDGTLLGNKFAKCSDGSVNIDSSGSYPLGYHNNIMSCTCELFNTYTNICIYKYKCTHAYIHVRVYVCDMYWVDIAIGSSKSISPKRPQGLPSLRFSWLLAEEQQVVTIFSAPNYCYRPWATTALSSL